MALTVNTDSYVTLLEADAYFQARLFSSSWVGSNKENALRTAAKHLDMMYEWYGDPYSILQAMSWPRVGLTSRNGASLDGTFVPVDIKHAQCELAYQWIQSDQLAPTGSSFTAEDTDLNNGGVKRKKLGPMETEYQDSRPLGFLFGASDRARLRKVYPLVDLLVKPYVSNVSSSIYRNIVQ